MDWVRTKPGVARSAHAGGDAGAAARRERIRPGGLAAALAAALVLVLAPGAGAAGGFTTSLSAGMTMTTPYVWTFDPGVSTTAGYFWADGKLLAKVTGPGPYSLTIQPGQLADGSHTLGHGWDLPDGTHQTPPSTYAVTVANPAAPASTTAPAITGTAAVGQTLAASTGGWSGSPTSYAYQWQDCGSGGCSDIAGADASDYAVQAGDVGSGIRVAVTATNAAGSASADSTQTALVPSPFTTSLTQGMTLTTPYVWTFDPGVATSAGYFWADGSLLAKVAGPGPYSLTIQPGQLSDGTHTLGQAWDLADGTHQTPPADYSVTVANASPPANTAPPAISGTAAVGSTLAASTGSWSGDPTAYAYQWQDCGSGGCTPIAGATGPSYTAQASDAGSSLAVAVRATNADGSTTADSAQTGIVGSGETWASATSFPQPAFTPTRTIDVSTASAFWSAWNAIQPGDEIDVHGVTFTGEAVFAKQLSGWAEVHFDSATTFAGTPGSNLPAAWIHSCKNIRFYGGTLTNPTGGSGITIYDSSYVSWWDFVIHDTASTGLLVQGIHTANDHLDLKGEIYHWGLNPALDPHAEKGTGLHGANLGDAYYGVKDSRFALYLHDGAAGSGVEAGGSSSSDGFWNNTLYLHCRNLTMQATSQIAGNCLQFWGENVTGNDVKYLEAENLQGRPYDVNGMYAGQSLATDSVDYGRGSDTNLNPDLATTESGLPASTLWDPRDSTRLGDVAPTP